MVFEEGPNAILQHGITVASDKRSCFIEGLFVEVGECIVQIVERSAKNTDVIGVT